jgi:hypothetical protein
VKVHPAAWVALAVVLVFGQTLAAGFVWDDLPLLALNEHLHEAGAAGRALTSDFWDTSVATPAVRAYWRPIPKLSHVLLMGASRSALPFHALNLALHLAASLLALAWLRRRLLSAGFAEDVSRRGALAGALLFALHPSRFEVVAWASCSTELFFATFALAGLVLVERPRGRVLGFACFSLAMLSKESALVLPALLLVDAALAGQVRARLTTLVGATLAVLAPLVARAAVGIAFPSVVDLATAPQRVQRVLAAWAGYHERTLLPREVTTLASDALNEGGGVFTLSPLAWGLGLLLVVAWGAFLVVALRRPGVKAWLADAAWWAVPLAPLLWLVAVPNELLVSDRFLYLPVLGAAAVVARLWATFSAPEYARRLWLVTGGALGASALMLSLALPAFHDDVTFHRREFELHPDNALAVDDFAFVLSVNGHHGARRALLTRVLAGALPDVRRLRLVAELAVTEASLTPDAEQPTLRALAAWFDALFASRPVALDVRGASWAVPTGEALARAVVQGKGADGLEEARFLLYARTDRRAEAAAWARSKWTDAAPPGLTLLAARLSALAGQWDEAERLLARGPGLSSQPLARLVTEGVALSRRPPADATAAALAQARVLRGLRGYAQAREVLAPLPDTDAQVLDARVQTELDDRNFSGALRLLEAAVARAPADAELRAALAEVQGAFAAWQLEQLDETRLGDPDAP